MVHNFLPYPPVLPTLPAAAIHIRQMLQDEQIGPVAFSLFKQSAVHLLFSSHSFF